MRTLKITIAGKTFLFELSNGWVSLLEGYSKTNYGQVFPISEEIFETTALTMLYAMGKIKRFHFERAVKVLN